MCNDTFNPRLAPLNQKHLGDVQMALPHQAAFAKKVFDVLCEDLTPQVNLLVAFVAFKELFNRGLEGIFGRVLYAPLSIVAKTGEHEWTRFRPASVEELHTSFLSFMMAKANRPGLERVLADEGLAYSQHHCCGIIFGRPGDIAVFEKTRIAATRNQMRSYAETMGMPVVNCDFADIPTSNSDLGPTERQFYHLYDKVFEQMTTQKRTDHIDRLQNALWDEIIDSLPECCGSMNCGQVTHAAAA